MHLADTQSAGAGAGGTILAVFLWLIAVAAYWTPTIIVLWRRLPHSGSIIVLNVFAFTVVCWIIALVLAVRSRPQPQPQVVIQAPYGYAPPGSWPQPPQPQYPQPPAAPQAQGEAGK